MNTRLLRLCLLLLSAVAVLASAQEDQASLLLDLQQLRSDYETAKERFEVAEVLRARESMSKDEHKQAERELLQAEISYQKHLLKILNQSSYIIVETATKYQPESGEDRVRITLRGATDGNEEYLQHFEQGFALSSLKYWSGKIYNVYVSLVSLEDQTIIGKPYEKHVPSLQFGESVSIEFRLLREVEKLGINLTYNGRTDSKNVYLEQATGTGRIDLNSTQFSQEADLGGKATFDLIVERTSSEEQIVQIVILNLPRRVTYEILETSSGVRLSQIKFPKGVTSKSLSLRTQLPDRAGDGVTLDEPIVFYALAFRQDDPGLIDLDKNKTFSEGEIATLDTGMVGLDLHPRGVGRVEIKAPSLYFELASGESLDTEITIVNTGTRTLEDIRLNIEFPVGWRSEIQPSAFESLEPEEETVARIVLSPPSGAGVGAQEVRLGAEAVARNTTVESEERILRIQLKKQTAVGSIVLLAALVVGLVTAIVIFGVRISRR